MRPIHRWLSLTLAIGLSACGLSPTEPTFTPHDRSEVLFPPACTPVRFEVRCTVTWWVRDQGTSDVTLLATWTATDSGLSDGLTPSSVAYAPMPGRIVPLRAGNIGIVASYANQRVFSAHTYAVDPAAPAVVLVPYLRGVVFESDGKTSIADARVEIVDGGIDTGKSGQTAANGAFSIQDVRMGVPLTLKASKTGYVPAVLSIPPIADDDLGYPQASPLNFKLQRVQP
jgi:hypothetical protein